jgi:uncharacterized protein YkwD
MGEERATGGWRNRKDGILSILVALALVTAAAGVLADQRADGGGRRPVLALATTLDLPAAEYPEVPLVPHEPPALMLPEFTPTPTEEPAGPVAASVEHPESPPLPPLGPDAPAPTPVPPPPTAAPPQPTARSQFYVPEAAGGPLTAPEKQLFDGMNAERANAGLPALAYDATLTRVGRTRVRQMIDQGYFAHVDPYGYTMYVELLRYFGAPFGAAGENLARNNQVASRAAAEALSGLMRSPGHRANMLGAHYRKAGVGHAIDGSGMHYFAIIFTD